MGNQPNQPAQPNNPPIPQPTPQPTNQPIPQPNLQPTPSPTPQPFTQPTYPIQPIPTFNPSQSAQVSATQSPVEKPTPKDKNGIKMAILCLIALLLIGGAVFAIFVSIKTQPKNIIRSAFGNLINAKQISVNGKVNISFKNLTSDNSVDISFDTAKVDSDYSTTAQVQITAPQFNITAPINLKLSNLIVDQEGVYVKVEGLKDILTTENIVAVAGPNVNELFKRTIINIGTLLDDRWIKVIAFNDDTNLVTDTYNCLIDKVSGSSKYLDELGSVYDSNQFLLMEPEADSFYNISVDAEKIADYANSLRKTDFIKDVVHECGNTEYDATNISTVDAKEVALAVELFPKVLAKFDGFLDYRLAELKINREEGLFSVDSDITFDYNSNNGAITVPEDAISIEQIIFMISNPYSESTQQYPQ